MEMKGTMRKLFLMTALIIGLVLSMTALQNASAQNEIPELKLSLSRDFGYSSGTGRIQGTFSMKVSGPQELERVVFLIDNKQVAEDSEAPFRFQFNTDSYALTEHSLNAVGYTADGSEIASNTIKVIFVSSEEGGKLVMTIVVPLVAVVLGLMVLSYLVPMLTQKGKSKVPPGQPRNYGMMGGTICPKCSRPYSLNFLALNLGVGKLDRCPHCGKWSIVHRVPLDMLRTAETAELAEASRDEAAVEPMTDEEKTRKALDDSRYQDL